jgi:dGTP triphosphohydrolase
MAESYESHVGAVEDHNGIGPFGFRSSQATRIDGKDAFAGLADEWKSARGRARLEGRTPIALDRDRILYSDAYRRQDDKFHVLFFGATRLRRTHTSHATKVAQVARSVSSRLGLNADLAEAVVLGAKVGGVPFLHVGKKTVAKWVSVKIVGLDANPEFTTERPNSSPVLFDVGKGGELVLPGWMDLIRSPQLRQDVTACLPWAAGSTSSPAYASGQQSYWMLTLNPFTLTATDNDFLSQTMYGVWRHSLVEPTSIAADFVHHATFGSVVRSMSQDDVTHEAVVVRYCDDITWTLENLAEASRVAAVDSGSASSPFKQLATAHKKDFPDGVRTALFDEDSGALYTYFIDDLVRTSRGRMEGAGGSIPASETEPLVALSDTGMRTMNLMKEFLGAQIFENERMHFRSKTLEGITETALDVLYRSYEGELPLRIERLARLGRWAETGELDDAKSKLRDPVHRVQVAVDVMAAMSDREIFELVGLE